MVQLREQPLVDVTTPPATPTRNGGRVRKLVYLVSEDWAFWMHRLPQARAARDAGYDVTVLTRVARHRKRIESEGFHVVPIGLVRSSTNVLKEGKPLWELVRHYRDLKPDLVHHVAIKPVVYGTMAALVARVPAIVNTFTGLGYAFSSDDRKAKVIRAVLRVAFKGLLNRGAGCVTVENYDDLKYLVGSGFVRANRARVISGSGVDVERFRPQPAPVGTPVVALAGRMLWDKGIQDYVDAVRQLKDAGVQARFVLIGGTDPYNPASVPEAQLNEWTGSGLLEWWGFKENMPEIYPQLHVVCLPSVREGLPVGLVEAAACGRAVVATDVPGCREVVRPGRNGFLVPLHDATALAAALKRLIDDPNLRIQMGTHGRQIAVQEFAGAVVAQQTLDLYSELLDGVVPRSAA